MLKMNPTRGVLLVVIIIALFFVIPFAYVLIDEYIIPEKKKEARLEVEEVYFVDKGQVGDKTNLHVFVIVTNQGDEDCRSHIRSYAVDKETNIALDDTSTSEINIDGQVSKESELLFRIPTDGSYRVEILVFENDKITVKGQGYVDLKLGGVEGSDYRTLVSTDDDKEESVPFLGPAALIAVVAVTTILYRRWRR